MLQQTNSQGLPRNHLGTTLDLSRDSTTDVRHPGGKGTELYLSATALQTQLYRDIRRPTLFNYLFPTLWPAKYEWPPQWRGSANQHVFIAVRQLVVPARCDVARFSNGSHGKLTGTAERKAQLELHSRMHIYKRLTKQYWYRGLPRIRIGLDVRPVCGSESLFIW